MRKTITTCDYCGKETKGVTSDTELLHVFNISDSLQFCSIACLKKIVAAIPEPVDTAPVES